MTKTFKNILSISFALLFIISCDTHKRQDVEINDNDIYFFIQTNCSHCHTAIKFVNDKYPDLNVRMENLANEESLDLFIKCAEKFNLDKSRLGTPLVCMNKNYILGWGPTKEAEFSKFVSEMNR